MVNVFFLSPIYHLLSTDFVQWGSKCEYTGGGVEGRVQDFKDLNVWKKSHRLVLAVYRITSSFPRSENFGLISQMRRSAVSIAANIAEGFRKRGKKDKINFYNISQGSLDELEYYLILAVDLKYCEKEEVVVSLVGEIGRMLGALINSIEERL